MTITMPERARMLVIAGALLLAGCGDPDSAAPSLSSLPAQEAELDLRVGSLDDPVYSLTAITALEVHESGRIYSLHRSEQIVRMFAPDGTLEGTFGGRGDGPGEFQSALSMGWTGDTLWVLDLNGYRFSFFSADGAFLTSFGVPFGSADSPQEVQPPRARGLLADGTVWGSPPAFSHQVQAGVITHDELLTLTRGGVAIDRIARIPFGRNSWGISDPDDPNRGGMYTSQPFADGPLWGFTAEDQGLVVLDRSVEGAIDGVTFTLTRASLAGDTLWSRTYTAPPVAVSSHEVDSLLAAHVAILAESPFFGDLAPATARRWVEHGFYRPRFRPAVTRMVVGRSGDLWLQESVEPGLTPTWLRLGGEGEPLQRVTLPAEVRILKVDGTHVWGQETDEFDVPFLVRYRIPPLP